MARKTSNTVLRTSAPAPIVPEAEEADVVSADDAGAVEENVQEVVVKAFTPVTPPPAPVPAVTQTVFWRKDGFEGYVEYDTVNDIGSVYLRFPHDKKSVCLGYIQQPISKVTESEMIALAKQVMVISCFPLKQL